MDMPSDFTPWTGNHELAGVAKKPRHLDVIQVAWFAWWAQYRNKPGGIRKMDDVPEWFVDYSQNVDRKPWGDAPTTMTVRSSVYSFSKDRRLDAEDRACCSIVFCTQTVTNCWPYLAAFFEITSGLAGGCSLRIRTVDFGCCTRFQSSPEVSAQRQVGEY